MDRWLLLSMLLASIGLGALAVLAHLVQPPLVPLEEIPRREGQLVCVVARVHDVHAYAGGSIRLVVHDEDASLAVHVPPGFLPVPGDTVRACGVAQRDATGYVLFVRRAEEAAVLVPWDASATPLARLAREPWAWQGQHVVTYGTREIEGRRAFLVDLGGGDRLRLGSELDCPDAQPLRVEGTLEYDANESEYRFHLDACQPQPG